MRTSIILICGMIASASAFAGIFMQISGTITDLDARKKLQEATQRLRGSPTDLEALEELLKVAHDGSDSIGANIIWKFEDADRQAAYDTLCDWYPIELIQKAMAGGNPISQHWALRKLAHQRINSGIADEDSDSYRGLLARDGIVTDLVLHELTPLLTKLQNSPEQSISQDAAELIKRFGILAERDKFILALREKEEGNVVRAITEMMRSTRVDPHLTPEIWSLLVSAKTDDLAAACLGYPWLFEIQEFTHEQRDVLVRLLISFRGGIGTNLNTALIVLARSNNPIAEKVLRSMTDTDDAVVKQLMMQYAAEYKIAHGKTEQPDGRGR